MGLKLNGSSSGSVALNAPADTTSGADVVLTLPVNDGDSGQYLQTNGSGALSWANAGKILQVVQVTKTDTTSSSSTTYSDITGMSASITPSSTSSKVLVMMAVNIGMAGGSSGYGFVKVLRGSTDIFKGDSAGSRTLCTIQLRAAGISTGADIHYTSITQPITYLDSPASTSATTYKLQWKREADDIYLNRSANDGNSADQGRAVSSIVLMEVAA